MSEARVLCGDCLSVMRDFAPGSFDAVITDPPAGIGFMGKGWDSDRGGRDAWIDWMAGVAAQCLRVLKPGAHALVWSLPRTSHWTATAWENAGFEVRDRVAHIFGSGFPKSMALDKAIDRAAGAERPVVGKAAGMGKQNPEWNGTAQGRSEDSFKPEYDLTAPATDSARQWQGWGTALKPAVEDWWLLRKPLEGTVAANVLKHGTGGLNIDGCRIETGPDYLKAGWGPRFGKSSGNRASGDTRPWIDRAIADGREVKNSQPASGRFPAHLILDESFERVMSLIDNDKSIRDYYASYRVLDLWQAVPDIPEPSTAPEVLLDGLLPQVDERQPEGQESSDVRQSSYGGVNREDAASADGQAQRGEVSEVAGRPVQGAGLCNVESVKPVAGRPDTGAADDSQGARLPARASAGNGAGLGAATDAGGDCPSSERNQARQPAGEPRPIKRRRPQENAPSPVARSQAAQGRERAFAGATLLVLESDIPHCWLDNFRPTGYSVVSPYCSARLLDEQSGELHGPGNIKPKLRPAGGFLGGIPNDRANYPNDFGGASRFFYCAKASRAEREEGLDECERHTGAELTNRKPGSAGLNGGGQPGRTQTKARNHHPTVKPLALMRWLVRLITPPGGTVLDCFAGSGSTGVACVAEGFDCVGIEKEVEYAAIARKRIAAAQRQGRLGL